MLSLGRLVGTAVTGALLLVGLVSAPQAEATERSPGPGPDCTIDPTNPSIGCLDPGNPGDPGVPGGPGDGGEARECIYADRVIECETSVGVWNGQCYVMVADPQPSFDNPLWGGRTDGVILQCTPYEAPRMPCDFDRGCPTGVRFYWAPGPPGAGPSPAELARRAVVQMELAPIDIGMSPPPTVEPPSTLVNVPVYLFVEDPGENTIGPSTRTESDGDLTVTATASVHRIEWDMGDGTVVACEGAALLGEAWHEGDGWDHTPSCGHVYERTTRDAPGGAYTVTATSYWTVEWTGGGQVGAFPIERSASVQVGVRDAPARLVPEPGGS